LIIIILKVMRFFIEKHLRSLQSTLDILIWMLEVLAYSIVILLLLIVGL